MIKAFLTLILGAGQHYQVCVLSTQNGQIFCSETRQTRQDAEKKALAINGAAQGAAVAWAQREQKEPKEPTRKPSRKSSPEQEHPIGVILTEHNLDAYGREAN